MAEISDERYEELRRILENQNGRTYTFEEVKEIGDGLIDFFNLLIEFANDEAKNPEDTSKDAALLE
jgi:hypothetical protein